MVDQFTKQVRRTMEKYPEFRSMFATSAIGALITNWANAESLLCALLVKLLKSDPYRAEIVFYSFQATQARVELVWRLAAVFITNARQRKRLHTLLFRRFKNITNTRNMVAHAIYGAHETTNSDGEPQYDYFESLQSTRFPAGFTGSDYVTFRKLDRQLLKEIEQAVTACIKFNDDLRKFIRDCDRCISDSPRELTHTHGELR